MKRKEVRIQEALGLAQECTRCHKVKILQNFPVLKVEDGASESISQWCRQCFNETVKSIFHSNRQIFHSA